VNPQLRNLNSPNEATAIIGTELMSQVTATRSQTDFAVYYHFVKVLLGVRISIAGRPGTYFRPADSQVNYIANHYGTQLAKDNLRSAVRVVESSTSTLEWDVIEVEESDEE